ncbi:amino acid permease [Priestia aryabhattai]|uniref:amino acid permease n=1 Tax=Priestia aryabhattai TaxID=412384 RepID=UPI00203B2C1A|nr:amino acid permease [Priestia aryabhattai]MCM3771739.1 amino acid permease [Priestia aryabhattai]
MKTKQNESDLQRTIKGRHLFMITLGGVIGSGFFIGSGYTISHAGPAGTILAYLVGGLMMYLTMLCLGELSVAMPVSGSFQDYATKFINPATGFTIGWMYWLSWGTTVSLELTAIGILMERWFPHTPIWIWCLVFAVLLFVTNAFSARSYAESEFWFSIIKVVTIILFILLGGAALFGLIPLENSKNISFSHITEDGLFPTGFVSVLLTMVAVNFSFQGTELIGIAAGESENPEKTLPKAINNTIWRVMIFFILTIAVLVGIIPWKQAGLLESPFVAVFEQLGVPYAADIMNFVILTALVSVANSGLFATTRILYSLSKNNMAPSSLSKVSRFGIPLHALLVSLGLSCMCLLTSFFAADTVYVWLLSIASMTAIAAWMSIAASQYFFRRQYIKSGNNIADLKYRTPLYPVVPILAFTLNSAALVSLIFIPEQRMALYCGVPFALICYALYFWHYKQKQSDYKVETEKKS